MIINHELVQCPQGSMLNANFALNYAFRQNSLFLFFYLFSRSVFSIHHPP